ncbi:hypothetical protein [Enorma burkinafasonensis]|uniref:hypothetical protein n=1 Tax=Enorma burkinafasonensis TaxID=2590867 RepID=UPI001643EEE8|nr:hypothetical protein [Enorma burkinafasonensis]
MAASHSNTRAVHAGLSCGILFAVPVAAYAVTLPFEGANAVVSTCALPFAVGALAGVGIYTAVGAISARMDEPEADGDGSASPRTHTRVAEAARAEASRFFASRRVPKDVPVIARAQGALSEQDAWADIDSMLTDDSPISCDAAHSKDIYEIALEELRRETAASTHAGHTSVWMAAAASAGHAAAQPAPAAATGQLRSQAPAPVKASERVAAPDADTTATYLSLASEAASTARASALDDLDTQAARNAALASLDRMDDTSFDQISVPAVEPAPASRAAAPMPVAADGEPLVPMADYSGHEDMWAAALAALEEDAPARVLAPSAGYIGKHAAGRTAAETMPSVIPPSAERARAVAEGARVTQRHQHVNELIEEELGQAPQQSVRRSSHEYLRVIQGGTASFPRIRAEA